MSLTSVNKLENNTVELQIQVSEEQFQDALVKAYKKKVNSIALPGFRKGKAPRAVVEGMYGKEVFYQDAMDELAPKAFEFGVKEAELRIVGAPSIVDVNVTEESTVAYTFSVSLYPEVTLGQYKGLEAVKESAEVSEEEVDAEVETARKSNARMISVDDREAQMGDTANIDFDGYLNGERFDGGKAEGYSLELGSKSFVPGFEEQIVGMKVGEEKDLPITFPENYHEDLAGKEVVFKVKLNSLTMAELPALDDEFAKDVSEFDTLDEYRADVRKNLQIRKDEQVEAKFRSEIMRQACENMTVQIPEVMIDEKVEEAIRNYAANFGMTDRSLGLDKLMEMMGLNQDIVNASIRPGAESQVKTELLLEAIVKAEDIQVSEEEAEEYLNKVAESINAKADDVREYFGSEFIRGERSKEKATSLILDSAVAAEAKAE